MLGSNSEPARIFWQLSESVWSIKNPRSFFIRINGFWSDTALSPRSGKVHIARILRPVRGMMWPSADREGCLIGPYRAIFDKVDWFDQIHHPDVI